MANNNVNVLDKLESKTKIYLITIAILLIVLCCFKLLLIIPAILFFGLVVWYTVWVYDKRKDELSSYIDELTLSVDSAAKNTLINSPLPLIILETSGKVIWRSSKFNQEFANVGINTYIDTFVKELNQLLASEGTTKLDQEMQIGEKTYHVIGNYVKIRQKDKKKTKLYMTILYFIDVTKEKELQQKCNDTQTCIGIMMLDNYDEILQRIPEEQKPLVLAEIEKKIYTWAEKTGGLMIKKERDSYIYILEKSHLQELEDEKFDILEKIKAIGTENNMQLTLTIAISTEGESDYEKYKFALEAIDIALGRGGDQVVLKKDGKYTFFGGTTLELEKRTKVKARVISHALEDLIRKSEKVMVMGHINGDIDSIGSSLSLYRLANTLGKEAYIVNNSYGISIENFINTLKSEEEYKSIILDKTEALSKITADTLLIITDTHKRGYVEVPELLDKTDKIVVIDHHRRSTDYIENAILTFHEVYASSAAELVTEIIEYASKPVVLKQLEAESLYAGIMVDTKNFTFKTGVRTFEAAAYLRKYGIDIIKIKKWFQSDLERYNVIADIVKKAEIVNDSIGVSIYDEKDKNANLICAKASDELLTISNITASFVLGDTGDKICISGRSIGDINVQIILEKLGGGGHITLAGAQLENTTIEEAKTELILRINEYFTENT